MISKKGFDFMAKKLVSLLLVVMLAVGVFSMQALAATGDDDIEPYGITIPCPKCGSPTYAIDRDYYGVRPSQNECGLGYGHTAVLPIVAITLCQKLVQRNTGSVLLLFWGRDKLRYSSLFLN